MDASQFELSRGRGWPRRTIQTAGLVLVVLGLSLPWLMGWAGLLAYEPLSAGGEPAER